MIFCPQVVMVENNGRKRTFVTRLNGAEVTKINKWSDDGFIYYTATLPDRPGSRHFYRVRPDEDGPDSGPECLSCGLKTEEFSDREDCTYFEASMSPDGSHYVLICKGPDIPYVCIHEIGDKQR